MPTVYALIPDSKPQFLDSAGDPLSGGQLFVYVAGSSTKATTYTESDGLTPNANPVVLNSRGETASGVYVATGSYKLVLAPANDTDPPASAIWTRDNIDPINDVENATATEWASTGLTPTYVSATQFTLVGDQTTDHHVGRRFKATTSGGTVYGRISVSAYTSLTTITVVNDSGTLDAGLSDVALSFLRADNLSVPGALITRGDLLTRDASSQARLAVGAAGRILRSDGTDPSWGTLWQPQASVATTTGSTATISSIPSWVTRVVVFLRGVSTNGTAAYAFRIGDSGGIETTGYISMASILAAATTAADESTGGFLLQPATHSASFVFYGKAVFDLIDSSINEWSFEAQITISGTTPGIWVSSGRRALDGALTAIELSTSDTFDAGSILAHWS